MSLNKSYYSKATAALLIYDISSRDTFDKIPFWFSMFQENQANPLAILIGNKKDLNKQYDLIRRKVSILEGEKLAERGSRKSPLRVP